MDIKRLSPNNLFSSKNISYSQQTAQKPTKGSGIGAEEKAIKKNIEIEFSEILGKESFIDCINDKIDKKLFKGAKIKKLQAEEKITHDIIERRLVVETHGNTVLDWLRNIGEKVIEALHYYKQSRLKN